MLMVQTKSINRGTESTDSPIICIYALNSEEINGIATFTSFFDAFVTGSKWDRKQKRFASINANPYKTLKAVSRQPLTNFVNLKSNTIMKKPHCKDTLVKSICQAFYR